jgi:antitoxin (DNA-binding transcriptional repressor) of toxin-antitoxin stability system
MDEVQKTRRAITVTKRGKAVAKVVPVDDDNPGDDIFGFWAGKVEITGDIISPAFDLDEWDCLR